MRFRNVDDILKHYGWGGEVKLVEVKKDDGSQGVSRVGKDSEGKRLADTDAVESVSEEHDNSL
jgi:hypothetical protein